MYVTFVFNNQNYQITEEDNNLLYQEFGYISLPNGDILEVGSWLEINPPIPQNLEIIGKIGQRVPKAPIYPAQLA